MVEPRQPDERREVTVDGHRVVTYSYGAGDDVIFLLIFFGREGMA